METQKEKVQAYLGSETGPEGPKIASWTWDVTHERALIPADLFGGKAPVGALIGLLERIC
jgi:hypothetical protein